MKLFKLFLIILIEGISEWLPISSSGHLLIFDYFFNLDYRSSFKELLFIIIQLGASFAIIISYFHNLHPFFKKKEEKKRVYELYLKLIIASIPGAIVTLLFDEYIEKYLHTPLTIAIMLIIYGIAFILVEHFYKKRECYSDSISYKDAFFIGLFQTLSIIPGTSRSGATIVGGLSLGQRRETISEFSFYMALVAIMGMSIIKLFKYELVFTREEIIVLLISSIGAFLVSQLTIKYLLRYIKKHSFIFFAIYRLFLGFTIIALLVF